MKKLQPNNFSLQSGTINFDLVLIRAIQCSSASVHLACSCVSSSRISWRL